MENYYLDTGCKDIIKSILNEIVNSIELNLSDATCVQNLNINNGADDVANLNYKDKLKNEKINEIKANSETSMYNNGNEKNKIDEIDAKSESLIQKSEEENKIKSINQQSIEESNLPNILHEIDMVVLNLQANMENVSENNEAIYMPSTSQQIELLQVPRHFNIVSNDRQFTSTPLLRDNRSNNYIPDNIESSPAALQIARLTASLSKTPPTYSTVIKLGPTRNTFPEFCISSSGTFKARQRPPSYAEAEGLFDIRSQVSSESFIFGPDPLYLICPQCSTIGFTETHLERSNMTHLTALTMFMCCCWPCCLAPYCIKSCHNITHTCSVCQYNFGTYRPW